MDKEMFEAMNELLEKVKDKNPLMKAMYLGNKVDIKRLELPMKLEKMESTKLEKFIQVEEEYLNKINEILEDDINE